MTILSSFPALAAVSTMQGDLLSRIFVFDRYGELLHMLQNSILAGAILGLIGGFVGIFVMMRDHAFAVHGVSEMSFAGAALALLLGYDVVTGSMIGSIASALLIAMIGSKASESNSVIGALMPFGLGLGILFLSLYQGRSANKFGLLTGQIVSVDADQLNTMIIGAVVIIALLVIVWRPLSFASLDPDGARAKGVPMRFLSLVFMVVLGIAVALSVQVVGSLLVLALLITPAAAAMQVTASPVRTLILSVLFAEASIVGGILLALAGSLPISPYVTSISFLIYLVCGVVGAVTRRIRAWGRHLAENNSLPFVVLWTGKSPRSTRAGALPRRASVSSCYWWGSSVFDRNPNRLWDGVSTLAGRFVLRFFFSQGQGAIRAVAGHFHHVLKLREAVLLAHAQRPILELGGFQFDGGAASAAEQVVVVFLGSAVAVQGFALYALHRVQFAGVS